MVWEPTVRQTKSLLDYSENSKVYALHIDELRSTYAGQYVAINEQKVILSNREPKELIEELKNNYNASMRSSIFIAYVPYDDEVMIV